MSDSLGRRLRQEAEVNAALSQVSAPPPPHPLLVISSASSTPPSPQAKHAADMQLLAQRAENKVPHCTARARARACGQTFNF